MTQDKKGNSDTVKVENRVKHKEEYERYNKQTGPKATYRMFFNRVNRLKMSFERAIVPKNLTGGGYRLSKTKVDDKGRECTKCGEYKIREHFSRARTMKSGKSSICKICFRKYYEKSYKY